MTEDPGILRPLLEGLTPKVMPAEGDDAAAALALAQDILATSETPGAVLFVLDDLDPSAVDALNAPGDSPRPPLVVLIAAPEDVALPQLDLLQGATVIRLTPDDSDLQRIERALVSAQAAALDADERLQWNDRGWWLAWPPRCSARSGSAAAGPCDGRWPALPCSPPVPPIPPAPKAGWIGS